MQRPRTPAKSPLLEVLLDKRMRRHTGWSREELVGLESSWGPSRDPQGFVDGLIKNGDLTVFGMDIFGRVTYRPKPR